MTDRVQDAAVPADTMRAAVTVPSLSIRLLPAAILAVLLSLAAAPPRAEGFLIGMHDQKLGMWQDSRFAKLEIRRVRLMVHYDHVLKGDFARYDQWMAAARNRNAEVLLVVNHHSRSYTRLPTALQYRRIVRTMRKRYPEVRAMSAWNEANHSKQPTHRKPRTAAQFYNIMRQECRGCSIVAADVLDQPGMERWLQKFKRHAVRPRIWGLHNYQDTNHFRPKRETGTYALLKAVRGEIWLTEAGGIVRFGKRYKGGRVGERRAARATKYLFRLARMSPRIKRVYLYHWDADAKFRTWDSGLVDGRGRARPALEVLRRQIDSIRRARSQPLIGRLPRARGALLPLPSF